EHPMNTQIRPITRGAQGLSALTALAAAVLIAACGGSKEEESPADSGKLTADTSAVIQVVTTVVRPRVFEDWGEYPAELRGADDAILTAPAPGGGRVDKVAAVGTAAAKGEALCDIDSDLYEARLKQAQAALDLAKGEIDRARNNVSEGYVGEAVLDKTEFDFRAARVAMLQAK